MNARDLAAVLEADIALSPVDDLAVDTNGVGIDRRALDAEDEPIAFVVIAGVSVFTPTAANKVEFEVEESDDDSTYTDVADADLTRSVTGTNTGTFGVVDGTADDDGVYFTSYIGSSRYVRVVANFSGTVTGGIPLAAIAAKARPRSAPTTMPQQP